jgi:5-methylcytosine-specific restriction protein A
MRSARSEFSKEVKEQAWERCGGVCEGICKQPFAGRRPEYHHLIPAALGGDDTLKNCRVLCPPCHRFATKTESLPLVNKAKAVEEKRKGLRRSKYQWPNRGWGKGRSG